MARTGRGGDELGFGTLDLAGLYDVRLRRQGRFRSSGEPFGCEARLLRPPDVGALVGLHEEIISSLPDPLLLYRRDADFFDRCVSMGCVAGAYHGDRLIAYAALFVPGLENVNYGRDLGLEGEDLLAVGHLAGSAVSPPYRGNRLQRELVALRNHHALQSGHHHMCGEVVPTNLISIDNHLAGGFHLRGHRIDDFGDRCYVLYSDLRHEPRRVSGDVAVEVLTPDLDRYVELVDGGRWGFEVARREDGYHLRFGRFE